MAFRLEQTSDAIHNTLKASPTQFLRLTQLQFAQHLTKLLANILYEITKKNLINFLSSVYLMQNRGFLQEFEAGTELLKAAARCRLAVAA